MSNNKANKKGRIQRAVLLRTIIPMVMMGLVIAGFAHYSYKNSIRSEIENSLTAVAASVAGTYDEIYPGSYTMVGDKFISIYKGNTDITSNYGIIDRVKEETGIDVTLFFQNTRILTTLQDTYGARYIQTGINAGLYNAISNSKDPICYQVVIDDESYYACYLPLYSKDEQFEGIMATAVREKEISAEAVKASIPIIIITLIAVAITTMISFSYTNAMADAIMKICKFLSGMIAGNLDNEMPGKVTKRDDELSDAGKAMVNMQNAIRVLVERDPLTQLYNRRYGGAKLRSIQKHANKCGMPYAVCICDIDFFKKVNDTYGHDAGDVVLKKVAEIMRKSMSGKGFVARWGGEEFLLIFNKVGIKGATKELNKILETIRATEIPYDDLIIKITMSFGVVDGDQSDDYGALLRHADERLYQGKLNGRNQVVATDHVEPKVEASQPVKTDTAVNTNESDNEKDIVEELIEETKEVKAPKVDFDGNKEIEFLSELVQKMSDQLYVKAAEDEEDNGREEDDDE